MRVCVRVCVRTCACVCACVRVSVFWCVYVNLSVYNSSALTKTYNINDHSNRILHFSLFCPTVDEF